LLSYVSSLSYVSCFSFSFLRHFLQSSSPSSFLSCFSYPSSYPFSPFSLSSCPSFLSFDGHPSDGQPNVHDVHANVRVSDEDGEHGDVSSNGDALSLYGYGSVRDDARVNGDDVRDVRDEGGVYVPNGDDEDGDDNGHRVVSDRTTNGHGDDDDAALVAAVQQFWE